MKISKDRLKQIIKEEMAAGVAGADYQKDSHGYEGEMAKTNLWKIAEYAQEMHDLIADDEDLEPWVEEKIAVAAYMMDQIGHHLQYQKTHGKEEGVEDSEHEDSDEEYELVLGDEESFDEKMCEDC
jgi:hypothetical protein